MNTIKSPSEIIEKMVLNDGIHTTRAVIIDAKGAIAEETQMVKIIGSNRRYYENDMNKYIEKEDKSDIILRFYINLETAESISRGHYGPLFHRWLPDGEKDAIVLDIGTPNIEFRIWFERLGYVSKSIQFDYFRREIDNDVIPKQAVLDSGPLRGILKIKGLSEDQLSPFHDNIVGNPVYHKLGTDWIQLICKHASRLINILRINYGQYWIKELRVYDSRVDNLTDYCAVELNLEYTINKGNTWSDFTPDKHKEIKYEAGFVPEKECFEYITKEGWQEVKDMMQKEYDPSIRLSNILLTNQFLNQGDIKNALIQGRTSLELSIYDFFNKKLKHLKDGTNLPPDIQMMVDRYISTLFPNMKFEKQIKDVISLINISDSDKEFTKGAVGTANDVLHKGLDKFNEKNAANNLLGLLSMCKILLPDEKFKLARITSRNLTMGIDEWEKYE